MRNEDKGTAVRDGSFSLSIGGSQGWQASFIHFLFHLHARTHIL
jgi:hypothetical protein